MKRTIAVLAALAMFPGLFAGVASADEQFPPHGHMLVLGVEFGEQGGFTYRTCVDLANNRALPLHAHHDRVHFGTAGQALFSAGHLVFPTSPLSPVDNCAHLAELFGPPTK